MEEERKRRMEAERAERLRRKEERRQASIRRQIERGERLEIVDSIPEGTGEKLTQELDRALESGDQKQITKALKDIGNAVHALWGNWNPTHIDDSEAARKKYTILLSLGTRGERVYCNGDSKTLFFPIDDDRRGVRSTKEMGLEQAFVGVFGDLAKPSGPEDMPYSYTVNVGSKNEE